VSHASQTAERLDRGRSETLAQLHCQTSDSSRYLEEKSTTSVIFNLHWKMKTLQVSQEDEETRPAAPGADQNESTSGMSPVTNKR
jgi:hypothetical protein